MTNDSQATTYRTPEGGFAKDAPYWTVAYRNPRANRFLRVDLALTWAEAHALASKLAISRPDIQVYYTTNAASERDGHTCAEDTRNIMVDSGRRVRVLEGGTLTEFGTVIALEYAAAARADKEC